MAVGVSAAVANAILNAYCRNVAWTQPPAFYVKLHLGDPGAAGTTLPATVTTRVLGTFSAASGGAITNSAALDWLNYSTAETISHVSFWDAATVGTFIGSDALEVARTLAVGDNFQIAVGDIDLTVTAVAA